MMVTTFEQAQEIFAAKLQGYTRRAHQIALAEVIEQAIAEGKHILAQAGTGTGKSFALTIPAILAKIRTILATPVKALQNQYVKDMQFLEENLGVPFKWAVLKGRYNYPCYAKVKSLQSPTQVQRQILARMEELAQPAAILAMETTDREDFVLTDEQWKPFGMSTEECPGAKNCPFGQQCLAERAKARAKAADIVITNTAYLLQDRKLALQTGDTLSLLGEFGLLIIDEAHTLGDIATDALKDTMGEGSFAVLGRDLDAYLMACDEDPGPGQEIEFAASRMWEDLLARYAEFTKTSRDKDPQMPLDVNDLIDPEKTGGFLLALYHAIDAAREQVKKIRHFDFDDEMAIKRERLLRRSLRLRDRLIELATADPEVIVRWAEMDGEPGRQRLWVRTAPVSPGPFLNAAIWEQVPTILSSATLTTGYKGHGSARTPDFDYVAGSIGLRPDEVMTYDAGSPFDYPKQALTFVPDKDTPAPAGDTREAHGAYARAATAQLVTRSKGGALLLYTSRREMDQAHRLLAPQFRGAGLTVLKQGEAPSPELVRRMKEDGNAVLFALKTFFQGVDIQGTALRLVVLDKLPFAVPSDLVYQARCEQINTRYGNDRASFDRLTVPMMILTLVQAYGRLIRHASDRGVVAILDSRLRSKAYGRKIMEALPQATNTSDLEKAFGFLEMASIPKEKISR